MNIIGMGRIGGFFQQIAPPNTRIYRRGDQLDILGDPPTVIATGMKDLAKVCDELPHLENLVLLQNGIYEDLIQEFAIPSPTRMLLYFSVATKGDHPVDGGGSVVCGPYSEFLIHMFQSAEVQLREVSAESFRVLSYEKLIWVSVFGVLCDHYKMSVSELSKHKREACFQLIKELSEVACEHCGVVFSEDLPSRLCAYSESLGPYRASLKEYPYRNGFFTKHSLTPHHERYLRSLGFLT